LKINTFFNDIKVNSLTELREEFEWLKYPKNRILILTSEILNKNNKIITSKFRNLNTKFLIIDNNELINYLNLQSNKIYIYYPPFLPFIYGKRQLEKKKIISKFEKNPLSLILKEPIMREEYFINENNKLNLIGDKVYKLGETNEEIIKENLNKNGNHLFIYISKWSDLENEQLNNILKYKGQSFSNINITDSKIFKKIKFI
jgi:hypothetical protein